MDELDPNSAPPLMCFLEEPKGGKGTDERVTIAMIAISPSTGDVVWDEFEGDATARVQLLDSSQELPQITTCVPS